MAAGTVVALGVEDSTFAEDDVSAIDENLLRLGARINVPEVPGEQAT